MAWSLSRSRWRKRIPPSKPYFFISLTFLFLLSAFSPFADLFPSFLPAKTLSRFQFATIQCGLRTLADERFLWYAPHSGFSNQLGELKNAILFAAILNRTLIVPPVLHHQAVALGSCPKFRVTSPSDLRAAVWDHIMDLVRGQSLLTL